MSVVAIRDGIIAADSIALSGPLQFSSTKLFRQGNTVIGIAGNTADGDTFVQWYFDGHNLEQLPSFHNRSGHNPEVAFQALVLKEEGCELWDDWFVSDRGFREKSPPFFAIGVGSLVAMGAMHRGATAVQAIEAACVYIPHCALPVWWEHIKLVDE